MKPIRTLVANGLLAYVALEIGSLAGLGLLRLLKPEYFPTELERRFEALDDSYLSTFREEVHDPVLGWDYRPGQRTERENCLGETWTANYAADGSRADPNDFATVLVSTYGDSFTHASEVEDDQTWQHVLSGRLGGAVKNFGVGGYGPLQALLKLRGHLETGRAPPVVILGIHERNIDRAVNSYRPFLFPKTTQTLAFKPSLRCPGGDCRLRPNPLREVPAEIESLRRLAESLGPGDYWESRKTPIEFSYFGTLLGLGAERARLASTGRTLWVDPEGVAVMDHLVSEFVDAARAAGSTPVVLLFPSMSYLERRGAPSYTAFREALRLRRPGLLVVDLVESDFDRRRFTVKPYECHTSVYGNRIIAGVLADALRPLLGDVSDRVPASD